MQHDALELAPIYVCMAGFQVGSLTPSVIKEDGVAGVCGLVVEDRVHGPFFFAVFIKCSFMFQNILYY